MQRHSATALIGVASRKRMRGAVMVEGIIVATMLTLMMAGGLFLHQLYTAQMKALGDARLAAWTQALKGCNSAVDLTGIWQEAGESSAPVDVETDSTPSFFGAVSHNSGSSSETAKLDKVIGTKAYKVTINDSVACNEIPQNKRGDILSLVGYIGANVVPSFF
jgi:hypothetical protein